MKISPWYTEKSDNSAGGMALEKSADALEQACINRLGELYALSDWTSDVLDETLALLREYGASCKRDGYDEAIRDMKGVVEEKYLAAE